MIMIIALILVSVLFVAICIIAWDKIVVGKVPFITLPNKIIEQVLANVSIQPNKTVYDLGCGDGRVLLAAAKMQPKATYIGIERAFWPYLLAKYKTRTVEQISIYRGDITKLTLQQSALVVCYLLPELLAKIQFNSQDIISIEYQIPGRKPNKTIVLKKHSRLVSKMFFYNAN